MVDSGDDKMIAKTHNKHKLLQNQIATAVCLRWHCVILLRHLVVYWALWEISLSCSSTRAFLVLLGCAYEEF